jgi:hypothetical protein
MATTSSVTKCEICEICIFMDNRLNAEQEEAPVELHEEEEKSKVEHAVEHKCFLSSTASSCTSRSKLIPKIEWQQHEPAEARMPLKSNKRKCFLKKPSSKFQISACEGSHDWQPRVGQSSIAIQA